MPIVVRMNDNQGVMTIQPNTALIMALPKLEGARKWEERDRLRFLLTRKNIATIEEAVGALRIVEPEATTIKHAYVPKTPPFEHQQRGIEKAYPVLRKTGGFALFQEPGTGKTKVAIDLAGMLWADGAISGLLVVAPKGVHRQWIDDQLPKHSGFEYAAVRWPAKEGAVATTLLPAQRKLKVFSINIDGIKTQAGGAMVKRFIDAHKGNVLFVLDESHTIKNKTSSRWKAAKVFGDRCRFRLALTGTPLANNQVDIWSQFCWLDERVFNIRYVTHFRNEFCIMGGFEGREIIGHKNTERFRGLMDPYSYVVRKEDLGVIPKTYSQWFFDLTAKQLDMIKHMKKLLLAQIDSGQITTAQNAAVAMIKLQQISSGFIIDEDRVTHKLFTTPLDNPRLKALSEIVEAYPDQQLIIWARFHADIKAIKDLLGSQAVEYYGETSDKERQEALTKFKSGERRFFISNPSAGGTGLDGLQGVCSHAIYYSHDDNMVNRVQSEDRIHRIGTKGVTVFIDMIANKSTDPRIIGNVRSKKKLSSLTLGDVRQILMDEAISDAVSIFGG